MKEREESGTTLGLVTSGSLVTSTMLMQVGKSFPEALKIFLLMPHMSGLGYWTRISLFRTIVFHSPRTRGVAHFPEHIATLYLNKMEVLLGRKKGGNDRLISFVSFGEVS